MKKNTPKSNDKGRWQQFIKVIETYDQIAGMGYRLQMKKEHRNQRDLFQLLCCAELLGIPNPVAYYTLEIYPYLLNDFHRWHRRLGMDKSPLSSLRCC